MNCNLNRHVCLSDLENYLKRTDYLNNYTPVEQQEVRKNIGAVGKEELDNLISSIVINNNMYIEVTHKELDSLIQSNSLKIGYIYNIIDFQTIYQSNYSIYDVPQTWGLDINPSKEMQIISIAIFNNKLDPRVLLITDDNNSSKWVVEYDPTIEILPDKVKTKGKITYLKDNNNNSAYYDFKNIKFRRTKYDLNKIGINIEDNYIDTYTFSTPDFQDNSNNVFNNTLEFGSWNNIFFDNCKNNNFGFNFKNNTFAYSCINNQFSQETQNNNFGQPIKFINGPLENKTIINTPYISDNVTKYIFKNNNDFIVSFIDKDTLTIQYFVL